MIFYIENKVIRFDKKTLDGKKVVGDNTDYLAQFVFDEEWEGKTKTARFINNDEYVDVILDENDSCYIPLEVMKSGNMNVGVYAGNLTTTTPVKVKITASILEDDGLPADPTPDVYMQLAAKIQEIKDASVSDEEIQEAVDKYLEENPVEMPTTTIITWSEEELGGV